MQKQSELCKICKDCPEQILLLQCKHNICLKCAYQISNQSQRQIYCNICGSLTRLDTATIIHLQEYFKYLSQISQNSKQNIVKTVNNRINIICKEHEDQYLYICITCDNEIICSQCVVHGIHKNHSVNTIKKFIHLVKQQINTKQCKIQQQINIIVQQRNKKNNKLDQKKMQLQSLKTQAVTKYAILKEQIEKEEENIINKCNQLIQKYHQQQMQNIKIYDENIQELMARQYKFTELYDNLNINTTKYQQISMISNYLQLSKQQNTIAKQQFNMQINIPVNGIKNSQKQIQQLTNRIQNINTNFKDINQKIECFKQSRNQKLTKSLIKAQYKQNQHKFTKQKLNTSNQQNSIQKSNTSLIFYHNTCDLKILNQQILILNSYDVKPKYYLLILFIIKLFICKNGQNYVFIIVRKY